MKRIIWISILLTLAGVIMPIMFLKEDASGTADMDKYVPKSAAQSASPQPAQESAELSYENVADKALSFTVKDGDTAKTVTMADYLPNALAAEMPVSFASEALKAQAVAARTYIVYCTAHENPKHPEADICTDSGCCLAYAGEEKLRAAWGADFDTNIAAVRKAVTDTDGQILVYDGTPILASFHSSSSGKTESGSALWGDVPYLVSVSSPETADDVPNFVTTVEVSADNLRQTVLSYKPEAVFDSEPAKWISGSELDESGRIKSVTVGGVQLSGAEMRKLFALRSTAFTLEYKNQIFIFTVTGYGHGLGMSQYGANVMAKNGFDYKEILFHYYPQTKLSA